MLLDLKHSCSLRDALDNSSQLDYSQWSNFVVKAQGFDLLLSDHRRRTPLPSWSNYHHLLDFVEQSYDHILVDLPEVVNDATVETVRRAKHVFIVCTPELPSLALAPYRIEELTSRGVPPEKISLVVNRWHKGEVGASDLEEILKHPVAAVFGNDGYDPPSGRNVNDGNIRAREEVSTITGMSESRSLLCNLSSTV